MQCKSMASCDLCGIPLQGKDIRPARLAMELRNHCLALRDAIAHLDMTRELGDQSMINETLQAINPDETRRTVDEFCLTQMHQEAANTSESDFQMEVDDVEEEEGESMKEKDSSHSSVQLFSSLIPQKEQKPQLSADEPKCPPADDPMPPPAPATKSKTKKTKGSRSLTTRLRDDNNPLEPEAVVFGEPHYQFFSKKPTKTYLHATKHQRSKSLQQPVKLDGEYSLSQHLREEEAPVSLKNTKSSNAGAGHSAAPPAKRSDFEPPTNSASSNGSKRELRTKPKALSAERPKRSTADKVASMAVGSALDDSIISESTRRRGRSLPTPTTRHSSSKNKKGERPLQVACISGDYDVIGRLLEEGENPNVADNAGWTPLHEAAYKEYPNVVRLLLEHGALIDVPGYDCQTALHRAAVGDSFESAEMLVKAGADCHTRDLFGKTPLEVAKSDRMRRLLIDGRPRGAIVTAVPKLPEDWPPGSKAHGVCVVFSTKVSQELMSRGEKFLKKHKSFIADAVDERTTHLICRIDSNRRIARSTKVVEAILRGIWIVSEEWLEMSIAQGDFLEEEQFEAVGLISHDQCVGDGGVTKARRAKMRMLPGLFRGCQFHIFGNPRRYQVPGCANKELMERLIKLGEGQLLSREPNIDSWKLSPAVPYYATRDSESGREFAEYGQFLVYMPGERMPHKRVFDSPVHFITPMWFLDCISKFELVPPDPRPVFNPSSSW